MSKLGIGIISFAHGHVNVYAHQIRQFDDARLVAAWDDNQERGSKLAADLGIPYSPHPEDVLSRPDVDCVIVGCETNRHADLAIAAMEAGKGVLLQKPMATTLADCDRMIEAADRTGVWFSLAFQMRHDPMNQKMRELVRSGVVGRVGTIRRRHCISVLFNEGFVTGPSRWHLSAEANRGMFFDDAVHVLDWLVWMTGQMPVSVIAEIDNVLTNVAPDDTGVAIYRYPDGMFAEVYNSSVTLAERTPRRFTATGASSSRTTAMPCPPCSPRRGPSASSSTNWRRAIWDGRTWACRSPTARESALPGWPVRSLMPSRPASPCAVPAKGGCRWRCAWPPTAPPKRGHG